MTWLDWMPALNALLLLSLWGGLVWLYHRIESRIEVLETELFQARARERSCGGTEKAA